MRLLFFAAALVFVTFSGAKAQDQATVVATCGAAHLTAGTQAFRQIDTNGVTCSAGGGSAVVSSVWSAADAAANGMTLSNGGLTVTPSGVASWKSVRSSPTSKTSGKLYIEFLGSAPISNDNQVFGLASSSFVPTSYLGSSNYSVGMFMNSAGTFVSAGFTSNGSPTASPITPVSGDVFGIAVDFTAGSVWLSRNNVWLGSGSPNPATGTSPLVSFVPVTVGALFAGMSFNDTGNGVWTLQPTAASQKYTPPSGFTAWDSGGATGCSQATAYLARATGEVTHAADLTTLICGLVSDGVWAKLDALYVFAQQTRTDAELNLIGTNYTATETAGPMNFTAFQGVQAPLSGIYLDTNFNPATATSPHFTQNSANYGVWAYGTVVENVAEFGNSVPLAGGSHLYTDYNGTDFYARVNDIGAGAVAAPGSKGLFVGDRSASNVVTPYWGGVLATGPEPSTSSPPASSNFTLGYVSGAVAGSTELFSEAHIGASLGSAGQLALYTRLRTYLTAVGVP